MIGAVIALECVHGPQLNMGESWLDPFATAYAIICPFPEKYMEQAIWVWFLDPSYVLFYSYARINNSSSQQDNIDTSNTPSLLPRYIK